MGNFFVVLQQMLVLFAMIAAGYLSFRKGWLDKAACHKLSQIVVNVLNPMIIINGVVSSGGSEPVERVAVNLGLVFFYFILLLLAGLVTDKILRVHGEQKYLYRMMMVFSNVGFISIPLLSRIYGEGSVFFISFYILGYNILLYTYGIHLIAQSRGERGRLELKKLFNPGVIACLISVAIFAFHIPVADSIKSFTDYMGNAAIPMSMMLTGTSIAQADLKELFADKKVYPFLALKLLVIPIAVALAVRGLPLPSDLVGIFVFTLAMPVGSVVVPMAVQYGGDEACPTRGTMLSTLASVLTIPVVSLFLN